MTLPVQLKDLFRRIPQAVKYTALMYLSTRLMLIMIGIFARVLLPKDTYLPQKWMYTGHPWVDVWEVWDSSWYLRIAQEGYPPHLEPGFSNYGFFPLYPLFIRIVAVVTRNNVAAALVVSNLCLLISCVLLYRLVRLSCDEKIALRSIKYLFLFPSAFILSGVFSESLSLALILGSFYCARKEKWAEAGAIGFFASLAKSNVVLILLPLLYEYFLSKSFRLRNMRTDVVFLLLIPLGTLTFAWYCYYQTGNPLAYVFAKETGWHLALASPFRVLDRCLKSHSAPLLFNAVFSIAVVVFLSLFYRKIGFSYWLLGMLSIFLPLAYGMGDPVARRWAMTHPRGVTSIHGMTRFSSEIFPLYILLGKLSANEEVDRHLTILLGLLQGSLMVFWSVGQNLIV